jgi:hypothetical protein
VCVSPVGSVAGIYRIYRSLSSGFCTVQYLSLYHNSKGTSVKMEAVYPSETLAYSSNTSRHSKSDDYCLLIHVALDRAWWRALVDERSVS